MKAAEEQFGRKIFEGNIKNIDLQNGYLQANSSINFKIGVIYSE